MQDDLNPADASLAMTTLLRHKQQQRAGRFGRAVPGEDVETDATGTAMNQPEAGTGASYAVDPDAVAEAILERLVAGRTLAPPQS
jgi:hypothetical protein